MSDIMNWCCLKETEHWLHHISFVSINFKKIIEMSISIYTQGTKLECFDSFSFYRTQKN